MSSVYYPMEVSLDGAGAPSPALNPSWADGVKLAWGAGLVQSSTGLRLLVHEEMPGGIRLFRLTARPEDFVYTVEMQGPGGRCRSAVGSYAEARAFLQGVKAGAFATHQNQEREER